VARITGRLADGSSLSYSNSLSKTKALPLWHRSQAAKSTLAGMVQFREVPGTSDLDGTGLQWFREANPRAVRYREGWPAGIRLDLVGSTYRVERGRSVLSGSAPGVFASEAELEVTGTDFASISRLVISDTDQVKLAIPSPEAPRLVITRGTGLFRGSFRHPESGRRIGMQGAILQSQQLGAGYFLAPEESGAVTITSGLPQPEQPPD
jgi:hypothetical protein